jgi:hypothetical protein
MSGKFEYKRFSFRGGFSIDSEKTIQQLNRLGERGWQLVGGLREISFQDTWFCGLFMREKR